MTTTTERPIAVIVFLLATTLAAHAQDRTGWGVSGSIGASKIEDEDSAGTFSGNALGFSADVEYRFTPNFALGAGGFSLGEADDTVASVDTEISVYGLDVFARAIVPVSDRVELFGRIGAATYFTDVDPGGVGLDSLLGDDAFELGLGLDFGRRDKLAFRVEGRFFNGGDEETGMLFSAGINYLF